MEQFDLAIGVARGIAKAEDPQDHKRMMQALKVMAKAAQHLQPAAVAEPVAPSATDGGLTLVQLAEKFFTLKSTLGDSTKTDYIATAKEASLFLNEPTLTEITDDSITKFMEWLAAKGNTPRTIDKKVGCIRSLMNHAIKHKLFKGDNPAADRNLLTKKQKRSAGSKPFDLADIQTLLDNPEFKNLRMTEPAFYWITLTEMLTGIRVSALNAVPVGEFKVSPGGTHYIKIEDDKTAAGYRSVPLPHKFFAQLFVFIKGNHGFGFKTRADGKGASDPVRKILNAHKAAIGYGKKKHTFHSFRKTLNDYLMHGKVSYEARCQFIGHETGSVNIDIYSQAYSVDEIGEMVIPHQQALLKLIKF